MFSILIQCDSTNKSAYAHLCANDKSECAHLCANVYTLSPGGWAEARAVQPARQQQAAEWGDRQPTASHSRGSQIEQGNVFSAVNQQLIRQQLSSSCSLVYQQLFGQLTASCSLVCFGHQQLSQCLSSPFPTADWSAVYQLILPVKCKSSFLLYKSDHVYPCFSLSPQMYCTYCWSM